MGGFALEIFDGQAFDVVGFDGVAEFSRLRSLPALRAPHHLAVAQGHLAGVLDEEAGGGLFEQHVAAGMRADILPAARPARPALQLDAHVFEQNILDHGRGPTHDEHAVLAARQHVRETHVAHAPDAPLGVPRDGGNVDRLAMPPPFVVEQARLHQHVGKQHVLDVALLAEVDGQAAIAGADHAGIEDHVADGRAALGPQDQGAGGRLERAAGHGDVLARPKLGGFQAGLQADAVIPAHDVAVADAHVTAAVQVDAVVIGQAQIILDVDRVDGDVLAAGQAQRPQRPILQGHVAQGDLVTADQENGEGAFGLHFMDVAAAFGDELLPGPVDGTRPGNGDVLSPLGGDEHALRRVIRIERAP